MPRVKKCEFCGVRMKPACQDTVCRPCDKKMETEQDLDLAVRAAFHAEKYKCRECSAPLPMNRVRYCLECVDPQLHEYNSQYEGVPNFDDEEAIDDSNKPSKGRACFGCKIPKPSSEFKLVKRTNKLFHLCYACVEVRSAKTEQTAA